MKQKQQFPEDRTLVAGVHRTIDPLAPAQTILWKPGSDEKTWERIGTNTGTDVVRDGELAWVQATVHRYEEVQRRFMQRLLRTNIDGAVAGPDNTELVRLGKDARTAFLTWMEKADVSIDEELQRRWGGREGVEKLGTSVALLRGITPMQMENVPISAYNANINLRSEEEVRSLYEEGISHVLGKVSNYPKPGEHHSSDLLRELKRFRNERARWAAFDGDAIIALESGSMSDAWMAVIPPTHRLMQSHRSLMVDNVGNSFAFLIPAYDYTKEWAGIAGIHEFRHLHDYCTGLEPRNPTRKEYIDGEVRAYTVELGAADVYSKGTFIQALDEVLTQCNLSQQQLVAIEKNEPGMLTAISVNLDLYITAEPPRSESEAAVRRGFYLMALALRLAERTIGDESERQQAFGRMIETMYEPLGVLPKK